MKAEYSCDSVLMRRVDEGERKVSGLIFAAAVDGVDLDQESEKERQARERAGWDDTERGAAGQPLDRCRDSSELVFQTPAVIMLVCSVTRRPP